MASQECIQHDTTYELSSQPSVLAELETKLILAAIERAANSSEPAAA